MMKVDVDQVIKSIPFFDLNELHSLEMVVQVAIKIRSQNNLTGDVSFYSNRDINEDNVNLNDQALSILEDLDTFDISQADQALLASFILSQGYNQEIFSSRDVNDVIVESGRSRLIHVTSVITSLSDRGYLIGSTKSLSLSKEGKSKAKGLIGMIRRKAVDITK